MTDASFSAAGYALLTEDDPEQNYTSLRKAYAPIAYGSKTFTPSQLKMSKYAKEFLSKYSAFKEFGHIFSGATQLIIILTDNKAVTKFFQTKIVPPPLWNPCHYYNCIITAIDIDVFSRYLFAYPLVEATATSTAKVLIDIMTKHWYNAANGQRVGIHINHHWRNNLRSGNNTQMCHNKTPTNYRQTRANSRLTQNKPQNGIRRVSSSMAQILTLSSVEL